MIAVALEQRTKPIDFVALRSEIDTRVARVS